MSRRLLFSEDFERLHGISPEAVLEGYTFDHKTKAVNPPTDRSLEEVKSFQPPALEGREGVLSRWRTDDGFFLSVGPVHAAHRLDVLTRGMNELAKPNETTLYHGGLVAPEETALVNGRPSVPVPYSTDVHVARSFAKNPGYGGGPRGRIFKAKPGQVSGLNLDQFGTINVTVGSGRRPENEFLVDPRSFVR